MGRRVGSAGKVVGRAWRRLALGLAASAICASASMAETAPCHGTPSVTRLFITFQGVRSNRGVVVANVYGADKRRFLADNGWLYVWSDPAQPGNQTLCLYLPAPGSYAVVMFHDANSNGDLDVGPFGPREGYGFSNNVRPFLRAPSLAAASFRALAGDTRLQIRARYP